MIMWVLTFLILALLIAPLTAFIAGQRGHPVMTWYVLGLLLGPLGMLVCMLPRRRHEPEAMQGLCSCA